MAYKNRWFTDETNTIGYIYIVRDPRAVACSLAAHSEISLEKAVDDLINKDQIGYNGPYKLAETPGSWKINYMSWKKRKKFGGIVIKYESISLIILAPEVDLESLVPALCVVLI